MGRQYRERPSKLERQGNADDGAARATLEEGLRLHRQALARVKFDDGALVTARGHAVGGAPTQETKCPMSPWQTIIGRT